MSVTDCHRSDPESSHFAAGVPKSDLNVTRIGNVYNGWQWRVREEGRADSDGSVFFAERIRVYEQPGPLFFGIYETFEEAKEAVERHRGRSIAATERYRESRQGSKP